MADARGGKGDSRGRTSRRSAAKEPRPGEARSPKPTPKRRPAKARPSAAAVGARGTAVSGGGRIEGSVFVTGDDCVVSVGAEHDSGRPAPLSPTALKKARAAYYRYLGDCHGLLALKGMGIAHSVPLRLRLEELFVPLRARRELPQGETAERALRLAGRELAAEAAKDAKLMLGAPVPVVELLAAHDGVVVLGDPGAGKTTLLKHVALELAAGRGRRLGLAGRLPILIPLSAYGDALAERGLRLDEFIGSHVRESGSDDAVVALLMGSLERGEAMVLLDGLDEVRDVSRRHTVIEQVVEFYCAQRSKGNKFVISSRIVGYRDVRPVAEGLVEATLVDFDDADIEDFVGKWTRALEGQAQGATEVAALDAERERRELLAAVHGNPGVARLAANPLLLTILALMKRQGVSLPERRVELYDHYVRTLLGTWNRARGLGRPPARDLDVVEMMRLLAPLALWMHEVDPQAGLVKREELRRRLEEIYAGRGEPRPEEKAAVLLADARLEASLLIERGPGQYGFIHLTFEEYLAAVGIAQLGQTSIAPIVEVLASHVGDPAWREVALLAVAHVGIVQQREAAAGQIVEALAMKATEPRGLGVLLAGEAVVDAGTGGVPRASRDRVVSALVEVMQDTRVGLRDRRRAGLLLGRLGWVPEDLDAFVSVPAGPFLYGKNKVERVIEQPYWIAKYPVTNLQFRRFIDDGGYERQELWSEEGWRRRERKARPPRPARRADFGNPIFPVVDVTWYEGQAYARWLQEVLTTGARPDWASRLPTLDAETELRLPTEEEWERAARGTDGREFPWGDEASAANATTNGSGQGTTAVATHTGAASPVGAVDMAGNTWEWTATSEGRGRVLRGGSWFYPVRDARCAARSRDISDLFFSGVGFRVVVSLRL